MICEIRGSYGTTGSVETTTLSENEKLVGVEYIASGYIITAISFTIAKKNGPNLDVKFDSQNVAKKLNEKDYLFVGTGFMNKDYDCFAEWASFEQ